MIKYKIYYKNKHLKTSYTNPILESEKHMKDKSIDECIITDLQFYRSSAIIADKIMIYVDNELYKEVTL